MDADLSHTHIHGGTAHVIKIIVISTWPTSRARSSGMYFA